MHTENTAARSGSGWIEAAVLTRSGRLPLYTSNGHHWVAGDAGQIYTLTIRNLTTTRIKVIASVDGRNVLRDQAASASSGEGMIIPAGTSYEYKGWRVNDTETREFIFGDREDSVAARATGTTANVGVIGFAVRREQSRPPMEIAAAIMGTEPPATFRGVHTSTAPRGVYTASAGGVTTRGGQSLGTGIGERHHDPVSRTTFTPDGDTPDQSPGRRRPRRSGRG